MTETQEEIGTSEQPTSAPPSRAPEKKHRSFGNKTFDLVVWPTVQWLGVWGASLAIAKEATDGKNPYFDWMRTARKGMETFLEKSFKKPDGSAVGQKFWNSSAKEWGTAGALWVLLSFGGTLLTPITKWFEHRREKISARIDKTFRKTPKNPDEIEPEPKQTWFSMLSGRAASITMSLAVFVAIGPKRMQTASSWVGDKATEAYSAMRPEGAKENFRSWARIALFDLILSSATALTSYVYSRLVARRADRKAAFVPPEYGQGEVVPELQSLAPEPRFAAKLDRPASHTERATREKSESNLQAAL